MPQLLEDLAEETKASNQRLAGRLEAEARELEAVQQALAGLEEARDKGVESARQATDYVLARVPGLEGIWQSALAALRKKVTREEAESLLRSMLGMFESGQELVRSARRLWKVPEQLGAAPERLEELGRAEEWFRTAAADATLALQHRSGEWQPADPDRLRLGLQLARDGKTVKADEARARFRRAEG
jgi:hypothetical protein